MMKRLSAPLVLLPFLAALAAAQNVRTVYFSSRFTEVPVSGRTGDINSNGASCVPTPTFNPPFNTVESGVINAPGVGYVEPGIPNVTVYGSSPALPATDFVEIFNFPQLNVYLGDADGDGVQNEGSSGSNFAGVDEIWIPASLLASGRHNTMHEMFISSWSDASGTQGYAGAAITEADMVLYPAATNGYPAPSTPGTPVFFIRQADWEAFFGLAAPSNGIDVDGFTVDESNGDIYASFDAAISGVQLRTAPGTAPVAMTLHQGAIVRIPGAAYTPAGPFGAVSAPLGGQAELVLTDTQVLAMVTNAGGVITGVSATDAQALSVDAAAGTFAAPSGFTMAHLFFVVDNRGGTVGTTTQNATATAIYSTQAGGTFATINGVVMNHPNSAGMRDTSFSSQFYTGPLDALHIATHTPALNPLLDKPLHMDIFPDQGLGSLPAPITLTGYLSGAGNLGSVIAVIGRVDILAPGGFVPRYGVSGLVGGYPDLYVDPFGIADTACILTPTLFAPWSQFPAVQAAFNSGINPVFTAIDPANGADNGDSCFHITLPAVPVYPSAPILLTLQALDLALLKLSDPVSFQFN